MITLLTVTVAFMAAPGAAETSQNKTIFVDPQLTVRCTARVGGTDIHPEYSASVIQRQGSDERVIIIPMDATELFCERDDAVPTIGDAKVFAAGLGLEISHGTMSNTRLAYYEFDPVKRELTITMRMGKLTAEERARFEAVRPEIEQALADGRATAH